MDEKQLKAFRQRLLDMRTGLEAGAPQRAEAGATVTLDQQRVGRLSRMDAMQMQAMARAESQRAQLCLRQIEAALSRIENGSYGECARCHEPIPQRRLETNPATPFCADCVEDT